MSTVSCPQCQQQYPFQAALVGKKVRCRKCQQVFAFPSLQPSVAAAEQFYAAPPGLFGAMNAPVTNVSLDPTSFPSHSAQPALGLGAPAALPAATTSSGAAFVGSSLPGHYGQVLRQYAFGPRVRAVSTLVPLVLLLCLGMAALLATGAADRVTFRRIPVRQVFYVLLPTLVLLSGGLVGMLVYSRVYPTQVSLTTLGLHFPKGSFNRTMVFVPFHDRPSLHVDEVAFVFFTAADLRLRGPQGKYSISKAMLPSDNDFYELVEMLKARLPFV